MIIYIYIYIYIYCDIFINENFLRKMKKQSEIYDDINKINDILSYLKYRNKFEKKIITKAINNLLVFPLSSFIF